MGHCGECMDRPPTVSEIIDQRPLSRFQIVTMAMCGLVIVLDGFDAQSIGFLATSMADSLRIPIHSFGPVFGAALLGLMISTMAAGPIADRWGRKWPIVACTLSFGIFAALTPLAATFNQLVLMRFLTGLGLGGAMSNVVALSSEYAPKRLVAVFVTTLFCGMPLGGFLAGVVGSVMLPRWGWQSVFYAGGFLPLALSIVLILMLPESVRFLEMRGADHRKIANIMARISPDLAGAELYSAASREDRRKRMPVKHLFTEGRAVGTILLWIPFFMNLLILYFVVSWLPALLRQSRLPVSAGIIAISLFSLGGVAGSFVEGYLMNWRGTPSILLAEFACSTLLIAALAYSGTFLITMILTLVLGFVVQGAQGGLAALSATFYPTSIRSTGVGWALGIGRIGSIVGPMLGGWMLTLGWGPHEIILAGTIPALCAGTAIFLSIWRQKSSSAYPREAEIIETEIT
jgi:AAHS family 4-hydroxybenzoate transporter-like MFS transporter